MYEVTPDSKSNVSTVTRVSLLVPERPNFTGVGGAWDPILNVTVPNNESVAANVWTFVPMTSFSFIVSVDVSGVTGDVNATTAETYAKGHKLYVEIN